MNTPPPEPTNLRDMRFAYHKAMARAKAITELVDDFGWYREAVVLLKEQARYLTLGSHSPSFSEMEDTVAIINAEITQLVQSWKQGQQLRAERANAHIPTTQELLGGIIGTPVGKPLYEKPLRQDVDS